MTVTIVGRPDTPGQPVVVEDAPQSLQVTVVSAFDPLTQSHGNAGGELSFKVTDNTGKTYMCASPQCTIKPLGNGKTYTFRMQACSAHPGVECSDMSPSSADFLPDEPPKPPIVAVTERDHSLDVTWTQPAGDADIRGYDVKISPKPNSGSDTASVAVGATYAHSFGDLTNGKAYDITVTAKNSRCLAKTDASNCAASPPVAGKIPFGDPTVTNVTAKDVGDGQLEVTWSYNANGKEIEDFRVHTLNESGTSERDAQERNAGSKTRFDQVDTEKMTIQRLENGTKYTFKVGALRGTNELGVSPISAPVNPSGPPDKVGTVTAKAGDRKATLDFEAPDPNGKAIENYQVTTNPPTSQSPIAGPAAGHVTLTVNLPANGQPYQFSVAACNYNPGQNKCGPTSDLSNSVTPFGPPGRPSVRIAVQVAKATGQCTSRGNRPATSTARP